MCVWFTHQTTKISEFSTRNIEKFIHAWAHPQASGKSLFQTTQHTFRIHILFDLQIGFLHNFSLPLSLSLSLRLSVAATTTDTYCWFYLSGYNLHWCMRIQIPSLYIFENGSWNVRSGAHFRHQANRMNLRVLWLCCLPVICIPDDIFITEPVQMNTQMLRFFCQTKHFRSPDFIFLLSVYGMLTFLFLLIEISCGHFDVGAVACILCFFVHHSRISIASMKKKSIFVKLCDVCCACDQTQCFYLWVFIFNELKWMFTHKFTM